MPEEKKRRKRKPRVKKEDTPITSVNITVENTPAPEAQPEPPVSPDPALIIESPEVLDLNQIVSAIDEHEKLVNAEQKQTVETPVPVEVEKATTKPEKKGFLSALFAGPAKPVAKTVKAKNKSSIQIDSTTQRIYWLLALGAVFIGLGFFGMYQYTKSMSPMLGIISVVSLVIGGGCFYFGFKKRNEGVTFSSNNPLDKTRDRKFIANSLNLYGNQVAFENLPGEDLRGQPRRCRNDNRYYYVHIEDSAWNGRFKSLGANSKGLIQFMLPDTQYRDPREFANNINIPAHRRLSQRKASLMEKVSPLIIIGAMAVMGIIWVAVTPTGTGG